MCTFSDATLLLFQLAPATFPTNVAVTNSTSDSFILSWDPPPVEDTYSFIRNYLIAVTEIDTGRGFTMSANSTQIVLNELHPFYTYTCAIAAYTVALGPYSNEISVQLAEEGKRLHTHRFITSTLGNKLYLTLYNFQFLFTRMIASG